MIQIGTYPPNYEAIVKTFPAVENNKTVIFTYGKVIYNPYGGFIDVPLQFHEATHSIQQDKLGPEKWWEKYLTDIDFRIDQEAEAYKYQYNKYCTLVKDRNKRTQFLYSLAKDLSSEIYGSPLTFTAALNRIKKTWK